MHRPNVKTYIVVLEVVLPEEHILLDKRRQGYTWVFLVLKHLNDNVLLH